MFPISNIKRPIFFVSLAIILIFSFVLFSQLVKEKNYNSILMEYISGEVAGRSDVFEEKVRLLRNFTHENVHPVYGEKNRLDTVGIDKLVSGIGWCDQVSRVFIQLAKKQGITTRLLFLSNAKGSSPHSIAEAWDGKRWVLVDAAYDIEFLNKNGKMASMSDITEDFDIVLKNERVREFARYNPWWENEENLTMYYRTPGYIVTKEGSRIRPLGFFPEFLRKLFVYAVQEAYILSNKRKFSEPNEFLYFKARNYHLAGRKEAAEELYLEILDKSASSALRDKTRFFLALLLRDEKRPDESVEVLTEIIGSRDKSSWLPYAYGLRSSIYANLGDRERALEDFSKVAGSPDAYF